MTLANLFTGFVSLIYSSKGEFETAALFILLGAIFDAFDGVTARLINAASEFGVELDSLCDAISFGLAPSYLMYQMVFTEMGQIGILLSSFPALAGVVRLARFNVQITSLEDKEYFKGMPIPSAALTILSYLLLFRDRNYISEDFIAIIDIGLPVLVSLVMVSNIKFENLPRPTKNSIKSKPIVFIVFIITLLLVILSSGELLFPLIILWIFLATVRHSFAWFRYVTNPEDDVDDEGEDESSQQL